MSLDTVMTFFFFFIFFQCIVTKCFCLVNVIMIMSDMYYSCYVKLLLYVAKTEQQRMTLARFIKF